MAAGTALEQKPRPYILNHKQAEKRLTRNGDVLRLLKSQQPIPTDTPPTRPPSLIFPQQFLQGKPSIDYKPIAAVLKNLRIITQSPSLPSQMKQR